MNGITWRGESIDDVELLPKLPRELTHLLTDTNGFILHHGALHVRGASLAPGWHSLRRALEGQDAFHSLYETVHASDIPFAEDQCGDQFLLRSDEVFRLVAETGEVERLARSLEEFLSRVNQDIEGFLNVGLSHTLEPGQLLLAYPPFCVEQSDTPSLGAVPAHEAIQIHAELARQIRDLPEGGKIKFRLTD
jgi:hypothetical protein